MPADLQERSRQIGAAIRRARQRAKKSVKECAAHLGTSWRRYNDIERGTVYVAAVELEELVRILDIPLHEVWPDDLVYRDQRTVIAEIEEGETVQVVVRRLAAPKPR